MHRRYRQIARLIYHYCCVRYMTKDNGRWVEDTALCPVCDGDGVINDGTDVLICAECGGIGRISMKRYEAWLKEIRNEKADERIGNSNAGANSKAV